MKLDKQNIQIVKNNYSELIELGIPSTILDNRNHWLFFLQEGWNSEIEWHYQKDMKEIQLIKLYWFMKKKKMESQIYIEIEAKFNLRNKNKFEIKEIENKNGIQRFDFFIDNMQLSKKLNIDISSLGYSDFDLNTYSNINRTNTNTYMAHACLGKSKAINQFGTDRIVLYRCHCGCDYCGIISLLLQITPNEYIWKDIRHEDDEGWEDNETINTINKLQFHRTEYELEWENYLELIKLQNEKNRGVY